MVVSRGGRERGEGEGGKESLSEEVEEAEVGGLSD